MELTYLRTLDLYFEPNSTISRWDGLKGVNSYRCNLFSYIVMNYFEYFIRD
ncbi:hypothetical protein LINGRAHAP2_LOCUS2567 [Linum grandiflorum]